MGIKWMMTTITKNMGMKKKIMIKKNMEKKTKNKNKKQ